MAIETVNDIFTTGIPGRIEKKPELVEQINSTYKFIVTGEGESTWIVDLTQPGGKVYEGTDEAACTLTVTGPDLLDIVTGKLNGQMAFMSGKLKVAGDMGLAMKLGELLG